LVVVLALMMMVGREVQVLLLGLELQQLVGLYSRTTMPS
jgi:hypothetical protein